MHQNIYSRLVNCFFALLLLTSHFGVSVIPAQAASDEILSNVPVQPRVVPAAPQGANTFSHQAFTAAKSWNFDATVEGWVGAPSNSFAWQAGGYVGGTITGSDPKMLSASGLNINRPLAKVRF